MINTDNLTFPRATIDDLEVLVDTRIRTLHAANNLPDTEEMPDVRDNTRDYYRAALADDSHVAYLVYEGDKIIGTGGVTFYSVMPMYVLKTGKCAYIMNMYTDPDYRRRGIAQKTLALLVDEVRSRGLISVGLEATDAGLPLYEKYGFISQPREMRLEL